MEFTNTFTVNAPVERVWSLLMQPEEVTSCVPGAAITEKVDDQHFKGTVKVKLGAVQVSYRGEMEMQPDASAHTIVLSGKGTETRGSGGASGSMTVSLAEDGVATAVTVDSRVDVTGKVATFGRGIMQDVANRLTKQFATCLASKLEAPAGAAPGSAADDVLSLDAVGSATSEESGAAGDTDSPHPVAARPPASVTADPQPDNELRIMDIIADITRARAAAALRALAAWIEPS
jgi:carbon monoxide dehydrogenase subunit G